ncbi:unnamed protein product [Eruca vesicaria subsp. sativa]|uniref:Uncharacterized protein n=1 Tax=Eruca vesicaria subsp. sativa TaxID=29727 RepID=A0ABC8LS12_ERUVS|nr:unnamed protein product [Eruca vesicaria subsp. sativa]
MDATSIVAEAVNNQFSGLSVEESNANVPVNHIGSSSVSEVGASSRDAMLIKAGVNLKDFVVDKSTYVMPRSEPHAQIRASFYPKVENEKTDQEIRTRMIEVVSKGLATLKVSLKHSGSLFMYAGHTGGAYAKNSYGNIFT